MNARERTEVFTKALPDDLPKDARKILKRVRVPRVDVIKDQLSLKDSVSDADAVVHYARFLLEHIKDPVTFTQQVQDQLKMYLEMGLKPIPLYPGTKVPIGEKWRERYATLGKRDVPLVWNTINNIGLLTGPPSNLLVLDFESEDAFNAWLDVLTNHPDFQKIKLLDRFSPTPLVKTRRGVHVWYIVEDTSENLEKLRNINGMTHRFFKDFEIRWAEGQVAAPPSLHPSGKFYKFLEHDGIKIGPPEIEIKKITVEDVARILDVYHKTGRIKIKTFKLNDFLDYLAYLLGVEDKYKATTSYAVAKIDFNTVVDDKKEAALLNALKKIWPEPGGGRWAASCAISALLGILGVPQETTSRLIEKLVRTLQPETPERWIRDLAYIYPKVTYRDLEDYKKKVEEAKKLGNPVPKLPVSYKSLLLMHTSFTEEQIDEVRREVEQILGVKVAERLGLKPEKIREEKEEDQDLEEIVQHFLLDDELQVGTPTVEKDKIKLEEGLEIQVKVIKIPIVHYWGGTIRASTKSVVLPDDPAFGDKFEPTYRYNHGNALIVKPVKIEKAAFLQEDVYVRLRVGGVRIEGSIETVVSELQRRGLLAPNKGSWVKTYLSFLAEKEKGEYFTTFGVNKTKDGKFVWVSIDNDKYYPLFPSAMTVLGHLDQYIKNSSPELYEKFIHTILEYKKYINKEAYWFAMSYMFVSPFLSAASRIFKLLPILYLYNPVVGSGKSNLAKFMILVGHGIKPLDKEYLESNFRLLDTFAAVSGALMFDEVAKINKEILDLLIAAVTGAGTSARGRGIASLKEYEPVATAVFTSNKEAWQINSEPRWLDRIVQVYVEAKTELSGEYLVKIDEPFALSANRDSDRVTVAHYFIPELVELVNERGGEKFLRARFKKWFEWGAERGLGKKRGGRILHKFATFMVGLELMALFLRRKGVTIDIQEGARVIYEHFKEESSEIPRPIKDLILALATTKDSYGNYLLDTAEHVYKGMSGYVITTKILTMVKDDPRNREKQLPASLSEIAKLIASIGKYGTEKDIYRIFNIEGGEKVRGVFISKEIVDDVLGIVRAIEEEIPQEPDWSALDQIVNILSMQPSTFDELREMTGLPEISIKKALEKLEKDGLIWAKDGKYWLINKKKAKEMGFNIVEVIGGE